MKTLLRILGIVLLTAALLSQTSCSGRMTCPTYAHSKNVKKSYTTVHVANMQKKGMQRRR